MIVLQMKWRLPIGVAQPLIHILHKLKYCMRMLSLSPKLELHENPFGELTGCAGKRNHLFVECQRRHPDEYG